MRSMLNRYNWKISTAVLLQYPPDELGSGGGAGGGESGGGESGTGADVLGDGEGGILGAKKPEENPDDKLGMDSLYDPKEEETFKVPDDDSYDYGAISEEQKAANAQLGETIKTHIGNFNMTAADIPDDLDLTNKESLAKFMSNSNQSTVRKSIELLAPIVTHALKTVVGKLEQRINSSVNQSGKVSEAKRAFESLGFSDPADKKLALDFFNRGLNNKLTIAQSQTATRNAMKSLGKTAKPANSGNGGGGSSSNPEKMKTGVDALNDMFSGM